MTANAARSAALPDAATAAMASGWTKDSEPSSASKARASRSNALATRRSGAAPRRQADPVPESSGQVEHVEVAGLAQFLDRAVEGTLDVGEIGGDVVTPEELMRQCAPAHEDLVGQLAPQHPPIGHALAGALLGQPVERRHAHRREGEQVAVVTAVDDEGVAELASCLGQGRDGVDRRRRPTAARPSPPPGASARWSACHWTPCSPSRAGLIIPAWTGRMEPFPGASVMSM